MSARQPAQHERPRDDGQRPRRLPLAPLLDQLPGSGPRRPSSPGPRGHPERRGGGQECAGEVDPAGAVVGRRRGSGRQQAVGGLARQTERAVRRRLAAGRTTTLRVVPCCSWVGLTHGLGRVGSRFSVFGGLG